MKLYKIFAVIKNKDYILEDKVQNEKNKSKYYSHNFSFGSRFSRLCRNAASYSKQFLDGVYRMGYFLFVYPSAAFSLQPKITEKLHGLDFPSDKKRNKIIFSH
jgi:hypothetical protein